MEPAAERSPSQARLAADVAASAEHPKSSAAVFKYETLVAPGHDAERITTAFYRFLELQSVARTDSAWVQTEIIGTQERRTVILWSEDAVQDFRLFLSTFKLERPGGLFPSFGERPHSGR
jgi:hypothetical protein